MRNIRIFSMGNRNASKFSHEEAIWISHAEEAIWISHAKYSRLQQESKVGAKSVCSQRVRAAVKAIVWVINVIIIIYREAIAKLSRGYRETSSCRRSDPADRKATPATSA